LTFKDMVIVCRVKISVGIMIRVGNGMHTPQ